MSETLSIIENMFFNVWFDEQNGHLFLENNVTQC